MGNISAIGDIARVAEEGQASLRGIYHLNKNFGRDVALRGAKSLLPSFASYLVQPSLTHFVLPKVTEFTTEKIAKQWM